MKHHISLILLLSMTVMLVMAGESMLTAALPEIEHDFAVPGIYESWILPVVLLVGAAASPFVGTAGDRYGHKRLLLVCLGIYFLGLCGGIFAPDIWVLLISRALQGAGIAAFPLAYAIIRERMPETLADTGIGVISAMYGAGTFIGVIAGSFITGFFSWRLTYLFLIPFSLLLIVLVWYFIQNDDPRERAGTLDVAGFFSLLLFLFMGLMFLSMPGEEMTGMTGFVVLGCSILGLILFIRIERRATIPLADFELLKKRPVAVFMVIGFLTILTFFILLQMMPYIIRLPTGLGLTAEMVGLILIPGTICDMVAGPLTGRLIPRIGSRVPCVIGSLFFLSAGILLFVFPLSIEILVIAWMVFSFGMSMIATADLIGVMDHVREDRTAEATGIIQSMQTLGGMAGPIVTGIILSSSQVSMVYQGEEWQVPQMESYYLVFLAVVLISLVILFVSWFIMKDNRVNGKILNRS
ncbi:MFS transporter [Methanospirillum sp.]